MIAPCAAALLLWLWRYCALEPIETRYEWAAALSDLLLYGAIGCAFVFRWFALWRGETRRETEPPKAQTARAPWKTDLRIFLALLGVHAARMLLAYLWLLLAEEYDGTLFDSLGRWWGGDTGHYLEIAEHWYADWQDMGVVWRLVFLPFYGVLIKAVEPLTGSYFHAGLLVSVLCSSAAGCVLYRLARIGFDPKTASRAVRYYAIFPAALFYTAVLSEGAYILLALLCVYAARKRRWAVSSVFGGLAAFTRSVGILLLVPVCFLWLTEYLRSKARKTLLWGLSLLLIPAGFGAYLLINLLETGSAWTFTVMQREHWSQTLGPFFGAARYSAAYAVNWFRAGKIQDAIGLWGAGLSARFSALLLMLFTAKRQHPADLAYVLAYYAVTMGATWLLSAPRYLLVLYPLVLAAAILGKNRRFDALFSAACLVLGQAYLYAFLFRFDVY